jgi:hypothetical protein
MIIDRQEDVTPAVLVAMSKGNARLREVISSLVAHLHAFAREVRLTEEEWEYGIDFLNRIGKATHDTHNEGVLFSDAIGFSTLICLLNNGNNGAAETASALLGPFWRKNSPHTETAVPLCARLRRDRNSLLVAGSSILKEPPSLASRSTYGSPRRSGSMKTRTKPRRT